MNSVVSEDDGTAEVCAVMYSTDADCTLDSPFTINFTTFNDNAGIIIICSAVFF